MRFIRVGSDVQVAVEDINPKGSKTVFFIHGWPLDHRIFEYQYDVLLSEGVRCVSMDLRGFGQSDTTAGGYDYDQLARDVQKVLSHMSLNNVTLAGFSMGGAVALRYMSLFSGQRVQKLALLAAAAPSFVQTTDYPYGFTVEQVEDIIHHAYMDRPQAVSDFGKMFFGQQPSEELAQWFTSVAWDQSGLGTIETAKTLRDSDLRADLAHVKVPTGIFHGKLDKICPFEFALELQKGIRNATLHPFEHSGHAIFYDELDAFNEQFLKFILS